MAHHRAGWRALRRGALCLAVGVALLLSVCPAPPVRAAVPATIVTSAATRQPEIALTFDDGPSPYTPRILQVLREYRAHATFFVVGEYARMYGATLRQALADGNELGNHTFDHADLLRLSHAGIAGELSGTQEAVRAVTGVTPGWFRPPYGAVNARVSAEASALGLRTAIWSVDPRDWSRPGAARIAGTILATVHPGSIVIMHDGGGDRSQTVAALSIVLAGFRQRGLRSVTMSELFGLTPQCRVQGGPARFSRLGIPAHPHHAIFQAWSEWLCEGQRLGPATTREYVLRPGVMAQDFALSGHRIVFNTRTRTIRIRIVWSDAVRVFERRGVIPRWGWAITRAWFAQFFQFHDWGPALAPLDLHAGWSDQRFARGIAVDSHGTVRWEAGAALH